MGTFTPQGTFAGVEGKLDHLRELGVTAIELMPIAEFPGQRNWGYDGVLPFAPDASYGTPEDLKRLVQSAHRRGLMVFLDVVYNHFGPEGNYLHAYAPQFFTRRHHTPWGAAINFDGEDSRTVRDFFIHNALYWLEEYHLDGLRLDAVHAIVDDSRPHILTELAQAVRARVGRSRHVHLMLENDANQTRYLGAQPGAAGSYDAQWNDDVHHALHVLLTGERDGYYADYADAPLASLGRCLAEGFAYQGEPSRYRDGRPRGEVSRGLRPSAFVSFLQNHDQVGNRAFGERIGRLAAAGADQGRDGDPAARAAAAAAVHGRGMGRARALPLLLRLRAGSGAQGHRRTARRVRPLRPLPRRDRAPAHPRPERRRTTFDSARLDWDARHSPEHAEWLALYRTAAGTARARDRSAAARRSAGTCLASSRRAARRALGARRWLPPASDRQPAGRRAHACGAPGRPAPVCHQREPRQRPHRQCAAGLGRGVDAGRPRSRGTAWLM